MRTTGTILDRIFATKREEVAAARAAMPEAVLRDRAASAPPVRPFRAALVGTPALIAEVKKGSPSEGVIRADFDPAAIARTYAAEGAAALSVLTDEPYFLGHPDNLAICRDASGLPVLRKDFLYDPYQILEARAWGADAVLLILAMLDRSEAADLLGVARELGMDALVETHTEEEVETALAIGANLVGVNSRDLATFRTDLGIGERLIPTLKKAGVRTVAESALKSRADIDRMVVAGADAVLIGTAFTRESDVAGAVRRIVGQRSGM